jgi:glycosyltransferase 2 family protein
MSNRQRFLVGVGILISAIFMWVAFNGLNLGDVWRYMQTAQIGWVLLGVPVFFVSMVLIAWRWGFLLRAFRDVPTRYLSELVSICYMGNNVYPLRAGEFMRIFLLQRDYQIPVARTTTTIFIERIFDGIVMLGFFVIPLQFLNIESPQLRLVFTVTTIIFFVALAVFLLMTLKPDWVRAIAKWGSRFLPKPLATLGLKLTEDVIGGMDGLRNPRLLLGTIVGSVLTWLANAAVYWIVAQAFGIQASFLVMMIACGAVNLAGVLPASPGQIGVFEASVKTVLTAVGVSESLAIAYAVVLHVVIWLPPTVLGFILLARRGFGIKTIQQPSLIETQQPISGHS